MGDSQSFITVLEISFAVIGVAGLIGVAWSFAKVRTLDSNVAMFAQANAELRAELDDERQARQRSESASQVQIAELRGQVSVLTGSLARDIVDAVVITLEKERSNT